MELPSELLSQFAKSTVQDTKPADSGVTVEGTAKLYGGKIYVQIDGSDQLTPVISSTAGMKDGDRVTVLIKDHTAKVTGNTSSPSTGKSDLDEVKKDVSDQINEFEIVIADKVSTKDFDAEKARIDNLVADNVTIKEGLTANEADIKNLKAKDVKIDGKLDAAEAEIDDLKATKLDAEIADIKFATIDNLEATNANIHNLEVDYGDFKKLSTEKLEANEADITRLDTEKLSAKDADLKYANIDFANIGSAAIENFFTKSGMIGDLVVGDGTITGTLVGVTIKGDLIEGGTVKADKLVIKGNDGLYYKLNTDGEKVGAEQTEYNSLNGSIITAKSITAEKISVKDLVAFGATIGGFKITDSSLYSGVKESVGNTTRGIFMGDDGQFAVGDNVNYLKFFKDSDGKYKLAISANAISFGTRKDNLEEVIEDTTDTVTVEYYLSTSKTSLEGGSWSETSPVWTAGKYIWTRTKATKKSGKITYSEPACVTGNDGANGSNGVGIKSAVVTYQAGASQTSRPTGTWLTTIPKLSPATPYLWTKTVINYTDGKTSTSYSVSSTLDGVEIGGRNLALNSSKLDIAAGKDNRYVAGYKRNDLPIVAREDETSEIRATLPWQGIGVFANALDLNAGDEVVFSVFAHAFGADSDLSFWAMCYDASGARVHKMLYIDGASYLGDSESLGIIEAGSTRRLAVKIKWTDEAKSIIDGGGTIRLSFQVSSQVASGNYVSFYAPKLERGNKATDWTPAPEDVQSNIDFAQGSADEANFKADENANRVSNVEASIQSLGDSISMMVTDGNGGSLMTQTENGWTFNIGSIQDTLNEAINNIDTLGTDVDAIDQLAKKTGQLVDDMSKKTAYINMSTDDSGAPCIELGKQGNEFKLRITNTSIDFMQGSLKIAYITNQQLYIQSSVITDEMKIGDTNGYIWKKRGNGHLGLRYVTS